MFDPVKFPIIHVELTVKSRMTWRELSTVFRSDVFGRGSRETGMAGLEGDPVSLFTRTVSLFAKKWSTARSSSDADAAALNSKILAIRMFGDDDIATRTMTTRNREGRKEGEGQQLRVDTMIEREEDDNNNNKSKLQHTTAEGIFSRT